MSWGFEMVQDYLVSMWYKNYAGEPLRFATSGCHAIDVEYSIEKNKKV